MGNVKMSWNDDAFDRLKKDIASKMPQMTIDPALSVDENVNRNVQALKKAGVQPDKAEIRRWVEQNHPG